MNYDEIPLGDEQESAGHFYTFTAYSDDHEQEAEISLEDGEARWHQHGLEFGTKEWRTLMHVVHLVGRDDPGDQEKAFALLEYLFGKGNVFLKREDV